MTDLTKEMKGKWRNYCRMLISYNDFKQACDIAHLYITGEYVVDRHEWDCGDYFEKRIIGEALNSGVIISYARPFSGNDRKVEEKIPDLPGKYVRLLNESEKQIHDLVLTKRNKEVAHGLKD